MSFKFIPLLLYFFSLTKIRNCKIEIYTFCFIFFLFRFILFFFFCNRFDENFGDENAMGKIFFAKRST